MSTKTIDKSTHHKLEKVSTKAGEDLYTTTNINNLLNIVDRILHSQWKEDTVKLDTIYLQLPMKNGFYNYAILLSALASNHYHNMAWDASKSTICNNAKCICINSLF